MFPNFEILPGIDLYIICLALAAVAAILSFGKLADKLSIEGRVQNLCVFTAIAAIIIGYGSAVLFQAFYNIQRDGGFVIQSGTGATFFGGLIGGAACFLAIYFIVGHFRFDDKVHIKRFGAVSDAAAGAIVIAHSIGRMGCFFAGCCHGRATDAWYGIEMANPGYKVIPTQLFEAIFLLVLFAYFAYRTVKKQGYNLPIYMVAYGFWRFMIEYLRDDYRGTTIVSFLTPSQLTAIFMVIGGIVLMFAMDKVYAKYPLGASFSNNEESDEEEEDEDEGDDEDTYEE